MICHRTSVLHEFTLPGNITIGNKFKRSLMYLLVNMNSASDAKNALSLWDIIAAKFGRLFYEPDREDRGRKTHGFLNCGAQKREGGAVEHPLVPVFHMLVRVRGLPRFSCTIYLGLDSFETCWILKQQRNDPISGSQVIGLDGPKFREQNSSNVAV